MKSRFHFLDFLVRKCENLKRRHGTGNEPAIQLRPTQTNTKRTMACFTAPLAQAVAIHVAKPAECQKSRNPFVARLGVLQNMLYGGSLLLAIEHVWHGEITWRYPFLTAIAEGDVAGMFREIATVGAGMAIVVTAAWALYVVVAEAVARAAVRQKA